jgi:hypothetical protein
LKTLGAYLAGGGGGAFFGSTFCADEGAYLDILFIFIFINIRYSKYLILVNILKPIILK